MRLLFVINTFNKGKHVLLDFAINNNKVYLQNLNDKITTYISNEVIADIFSLKKINSNYIFDIVIDDGR
jgi:hypothetical protein